MRNSLRCEAEAYRFLGVVIVGAAAVIAAAYINTWLGVAGMGAAGVRERHHHHATATVSAMKTTSPAQALITPAMAIAPK